MSNTVQWEVLTVAYSYLMYSWYYLFLAWYTNLAPAQLHQPHVYYCLVCYHVVILLFSVLSCCDTVVTPSRLGNLEKQARSLAVHQKKLEEEVQQIENKLQQQLTG